MKKKFLKFLAALITFFFSFGIISFGNIVYAEDSNNIKQVKKEIDLKGENTIIFGGIFALFSGDENGENEKQFCEYLGGKDSSRFLSVKSFGEVLYFILINIILTGGLLMYFIYNIYDIFKIIKGEKNIDGSENIQAKGKKDVSEVIINYTIFYLVRFVSIILLYILIMALVKMSSITCQ